MQGSRLANGLEVLHLPLPHSELLTLQAYVRVGSASEQEQERGFSHLLEHLLLRERTVPHELLDELEHCGVQMQGMTTREYTVYTLTLTKELLAQGLSALTTLLFQPEWTAEALEKERQVILREYAMRLDDKKWRLQEAIFSQMWQGTSYEHPILGTPVSMAEWDDSRVRDFYTRHYRPDRMLFLIVGGADDLDWREAVANAFADCSSVEPTNTLQEEHSFSTGEVPFAIASQEEHGQLTFLLGIRDGAGGAERHWLFEVAGRLLQARTGIAMNRSRICGGGLVLLTLVSRGGSEEAAADFVRQAFAQLAEVLPTLAEVKMACTSLMRDYAKQWERTEGAAELVGGQWLYEGSYWTYPRLQRLLSTFSAQRFADLFTALGAALQEQSKEAEKGAGWAPQAPRESLLIGRQIGKEQTLPLVLKVEPGVSLCSLVLLVPHARVFEPAGQSGLSHLLLRYWLAGTKRRSAEEIALYSRQIGLKIKPLLLQDAIGWQAEVLVEHLDEMIALCTEMMLEPAFEPELLEKVRQETLREAIRAEHKPFAGVIHRVYPHLFSPHPYGVSPHGLPTVLSSLTHADVLAHWQRVQTMPLVLSVCGDFAADRVSAFLQERLAGRSGAWPTPADIVWPETPALRMRETVAGSQAHWTIGWHGTTLHHPDKFPLHVAWSVLSGKGGRLYNRLRKENGYAYTFKCFSREFFAGGFAGAYVMCDPKHIEQVEQMVREECRNIAEQGATEVELRRAKESLVVGFAQNNQSTSSRALVLAQYAANRVDLAEAARYPQRIRDVTASEMQAVAAKTFQPDRGVSLQLLPQR